MPRWSLSHWSVLPFVFISAAAFAAKPACELILMDLRFDRPFAAAPAPRDLVAEGLRVDLDAVSTSAGAAESIRRLLSTLDAASVRSALAATSAGVQARAFARANEVADLAFAARSTHVTLATVIEAAVARGGDLGDAVDAVADAVVTDALRERARRAYAERGAPLVHDLRRMVAAGTLRLEVVDGSETIPLDPTTGAPDRPTFELAKRFADAAYWTHLMPARDRRLVTTLLAARRHALERAWNSDHYRDLGHDVRYTEPVANGYVDRPVRDFIADKRFLHPHWWESFATFATLLDQAEGRPPEAPARITARTSRSPLAYLFGREAERVIYWPAIREGKFVRPELSRLRVNETRVDGKSEAVEVLVNRAVGEPPKGYFFVNMGGDLVPALKFNGQPVERACAKCHGDRGSPDGRMTFKPFFFRTPADVRQVGYRNDTVIEALLDR